MNEQTMGASRPELKSVSKLLADAWTQYKKHFNILVPIMLIAGIGLYLQTAFLFIGSDPRNTIVAYGFLALLATAIYVIGMVWGFSALLYKVNKPDQVMTVKEAFLAGKPYMGQIFIVGLLSGIFTLVGFILFVIPGIVVAIWVSFAYFTVVAEDKRNLDALKASKAYVEGYWLQVFGRLLLVGIIVGVCVSIVGAIAMAVLGNDVGIFVQNIVSLGIAPFVVLFQYDLYKNIKSIKGGTTPMSSPAASAPTTPVANI